MTLEKIRATGALRRVQERAASHIADAVEDLAALPATAARDALTTLARRVGNRSL